MPARPDKRPRRKAKQARSQATVGAIVEAAARVLERRGFIGATTNRIAETAGVSVGTLYEYFADKEAVFDALIQREIGVLVDAIRSEDLDPAAPLSVTLERVLRTAMRALPRGPEFFQALEQVPGSPLRQRLVAAREQVVDFVRQLLEARRDELRVTDTRLAAFIAVSTAEGVGMNASKALFDERLAREIAVLLTLYLTGRTGA